MGATGTPTDQATTIDGAPLPDQPSGMSTGRVRWITDGDTIDVDTDGGEVTLRLLGINAPERGDCFAEEALDFLIDEIKGRSVQFDDLGTDQFGRTLADVWFEGRWINGELVASGLTTAVTPDDGYLHGDLLIEAEDRAYTAREGLWGDEACGSVGPSPDVSFDLDRSAFNPPGPDDSVLDDEYIVIVNNESTAVDLSGWTLRDESSRNRLVFDLGTMLAAGDTLTVSSGCSTDPSWCGDRSIWNNAGDLALLLDENGRVVARARY